MSKIKPEILNPFDAEAELIEKKQNEHQEQLKKEMRHLQLQISRLQSEIQQKDSEWQKEIAKEVKGKNEKKIELEGVEERVRKQRQFIKWVEEIKRGEEGNVQIEEEDNEVKIDRISERVGKEDEKQDNNGDDVDNQ
jgi:hypothetical protein